MPRPREQTLISTGLYHQNLVRSPTNGSGVSATKTHVNERLERILAESVRSYLHELGNTEASEQQDQLRSLCTSLARLLGNFLAGRQQWSRYYWVDDILPISETVPSPGNLKVRGLMIWGQSKQSQQYCEPFSCSVHVSEASGEITGYEILCGDAALGLGGKPYGDHRGFTDGDFPNKWLFTFSEGTMGDNT